MYKYLTFIFILSFSTASLASDLKLIKFDKRNDPQQFYLLGTSNGNYIVKSWQFNKSKIWNGQEDPDLTISQAVNIAKSYLKKTNTLLIKEVSLKPSFNKSGEIIWYYFITLMNAPYKFDQIEHEVAVLTSGEVVVPYKR